MVECRTKHPPDKTPPAHFGTGGQNTPHVFYRVDITPPATYERVDKTPLVSFARWTKSPLSCGQNVLKDVQPTPNRIVADYEIAIHNAVKSVISTNIHIQGCFYHLTQSTWRRVQVEGLQASYKDDEEVRTFCGMLDALAFLPVDRVNDGMRALKEVSPDDLQGLTDYFDATYVSGHYRAVVGSDGNMRFRRTAQRFPRHGMYMKQQWLINREPTTCVSPGTMASNTWWDVATPRCGLLLTVWERMQLW